MNCDEVEKKEESLNKISVEKSSIEENDKNQKSSFLLKTITNQTPEEIPERNLSLTKKKQKKKKVKKERTLLQHNLLIQQNILGIDTEKMQDNMDSFFNEQFGKIYGGIESVLKNHNKILIHNQGFVRRYKKLKNQMINNRS